MSEQTGNSESLPPFKPGDTQPLKPVGKKGRLRSILVGILAILVLLLLAGLGGYASGIGERTAAQSHVISQQLTEQFQFALVDEQFGRYEAARERLEFIIQNNPSFPGAQNELAKVLVRLAIPTATRTPPPTSTPDLRGEQSLFATAQQLTASGDWVNALAALSLRHLNEKKYARQVQRLTQACIKDLLYQGAIGHCSELSSAAEQEWGGCFAQAWSAALLYELLTNGKE